MRNVLEAIWWWTRLILLGLVGVYILALLFKNSGQSATLWYWYGQQSEQTPIITIVLVSFLAGGLVSVTAWALTSAMITYRRTREERRERLEREQREEMERKARMLRTKPAPVPIIRRPPPEPPRTRVIPPVSLDATPEELDVPAEAQVDDVTDLATDVAALPMPPVPTPARHAEPASGDPAATGVDLATVAVPLIDRPLATTTAPAAPAGPRDASAERVVGVRLPPPSPPPAGG